MAATETSARANAALDDLYRRYVGDVYRYTYAVLGNHADAEDVTQTTFVNALRAIERGETPQDPSRWLLVIAHNLVRQRWRQAASRPTLVELETDVPDALEPDDEGVELDELVRALQRIPPAQREALVMRELEGRSYHEIADVLGLTTSALETLLFRARRSLAEEIENVVTCQNAELAMSKRLDGRLSRKDRKRLEEHLAECDQCARLATAQARQRKAFKGLALLPLPVGLALFKGAPSAAAATSVPAIGLGSTGAGAGAGATTTTGTGVAGAAGTAAASGGAAAVGGSLVGGIAVKVAAVAVAATVATGVGYKGVQAVRDTPSKPAPAQKQQSGRDGAAKTPARVSAPGRAQAKTTGKALGHVKKNGLARGTSAANQGKGLGSAPGLTRRSDRAQSRGAAHPAVARGKASKPVVSRGKPDVTPTPRRNAPTKPTRQITVPPKAGAPSVDPPKNQPGAKKPPTKKAPAPKGGGSGASPTAPVPPISSPTGEDAGTGTDSATTTPSSDPAATPTEPTTGAPSTATDGTTTGGSSTTGGGPTGQPTPPPTGSATPPPPGSPTDDPAPGTPGTPATPTGGQQSPPTSNSGSAGAEQGRKLGHKKGKHDGKHPEDP